MEQCGLNRTSYRLEVNITGKYFYACTFADQTSARSGAAPIAIGPAE
jgi:hypothetical protein